MTTAIRVSAALIFAVLFTACGGGGGNGSSASSSGPSGPSMVLSTSRIGFSAPNRYSSPSSQQIGMTVSGQVNGTLYVLVDVTGTAVKSVSNVSVTGATGTASVSPFSADSLGPGTYASTITVTACVNDPKCTTGQLIGSPARIDVTYTVSVPQVDGDIVAPYSVVTGLSGEVIIRGRGFNTASSVRFGSNAITDFNIVSDTEIRARHGALAVGSYPVVINNGSIPFTASLAVIPTRTFQRATLLYPGTAPLTVSAPFYSGDRNTLFVVLRYADTSQNKLVGYSLDVSTWGATQILTIPGLLDVAAGRRGNELLLHSVDSVVLVDPSSMTATQTDRLLIITGSASISSVAFANDGRAVLTTVGSFDDMYIYAPQSTQRFAQIWPDQSSCCPGTVNRAHASGDGAVVLMAPINRYDSSSGRLLYQTFLPSYTNGRQVRLEVDLHAKKYLVTSPGLTDQVTSHTGMFVYDEKFAFAGMIPGPQYLVAMQRDGERAVSLEASSFNPPLVTAYSLFDLRTSSNGDFARIGAPVSIPNIQMSPDYGSLTISPDNATLFITARDGVVVQPVQ